MKVISLKSVKLKKEEKEEVESYKSVKLEVKRLQGWKVTGLQEVLNSGHHLLVYRPIVWLSDLRSVFVYLCNES